MPAVVVLKVTMARCFDTEPAGKQARVQPLHNRASATSQLACATRLQAVKLFEAGCGILSPTNWHDKTGTGGGRPDLADRGPGTAIPEAAPHLPRVHPELTPSPRPGAVPWAAGSSYATGFVVDKARGLILTNRHVVTPGKQAPGKAGSPLGSIDHSPVLATAPTRCIVPSTAQGAAGFKPDCSPYLFCAHLQGRWWLRPSS